MSLRQWMLSKDRHTYVLRWRAGDEGRLLAEIAEQVERGYLPLTQEELIGMVQLICESIPPDESAMAAMIAAAGHALAPEEPT
jgi:hypothetical protein